MLAYNSQTLDNLEIREEAEKALRKNCISVDTYKAITTAHPVNLYTPNPMIRVGLFILTCIIVCFSLGLLTLMMLGMVKNERNISGIGIFAGLLCYGALELFVRAKNLFRAGVDDALLWSALLLLCVSIGFAGLNDNKVYPLVVFLITLTATLRFADMMVAGVSYLALLSAIFYQTVLLGNGGKIVVPFIMISISLGIYVLVRRWMKNKVFRHYQNCLTVVSVLSLATLYLAGNYYVVRELSNMLFDLEHVENPGIPGGWFFWIWTTVVPLIYIALGIRSKDAILLRTGMILIAAIVFTVRYYHHIMPLETAMVVGGLLLTAGAWALIRYLKTPRNGFTYAAPEDPSLADKLKIESLVIAQTYTPGSTGPVTNTQFGGGSGGGGGASGEY